MQVTVRLDPAERKLCRDLGSAMVASSEVVARRPPWLLRDEDLQRRARTTLDVIEGFVRGYRQP